MRPIDGLDRSLLVTSYPALIQAAGYPKYIGRGSYLVAYRGQSSLYPSLTPSLYRGISTVGTARTRRGVLAAQVEAYRKARLFLDGTPNWALAALLQHYGVRTEWLDLVDNYWVALWFALHDIVGTGEHDRFLSIRRRSTEQQVIRVGDEDIDGPLGFIQVLAVDSPVPDPARPGVATNGDIEVIDLRVAAPSLYIRPHSQHGLLLRRRAISTVASLGLRELVVCTLVVRVREAAEWIGGVSLEHRSIFPSPHDDPGYHKLLRKPLTSSIVGGVSWVGY